MNASPLPCDAPMLALPVSAPAAALAPRPRLLLWFGLAYVAFALLSLMVSRQPSSIATLWYANAVAIAVFNARPLGDWPALALVMAAAVTVCNVLWGDAPLLALSFAPANLAEALCGAWLLRRHGPSRPDELGPLDLVRLLVFGGVLPQLAGATVGAFTVSWHGYAEVTGVWLPWFSGSVIGAVSVLPLAWLVAGRGLAALRPELLDLRLLALAPLTFGVVLVALSSLPFPFVYLVMPLLLSAGLVRQPAVSLLTLLASLTTGAAIGLGWLALPPLSAQWQMVYVYLAYAMTLVPAQLLAAAMDELRRARDHLAARTLALRRSHEGLEQFVRIAAHDLREPLNTVAAFGGLLEQDLGPGLDPKNRRYLDILLQAGTRMRRVLDDVLQLVRVQQGEAPPFEPVRLSDVLAEVRTALASRIADTRAQLRTEGDATLLGHPLLLSLVFQNLLHNALKFVPEGRTPQVTVRVQLQGDEAHVSVADNGIGIDEADLPRLFQPFQRLHPRRIYDGTGLGLALVRQIVELHGGRVQVRSTAGEGSCFELALRRAAGAPPPAA